MTISLVSLLLSLIYLLDVFLVKGVKQFCRLAPKFLLRIINAMYLKKMVHILG